jgi:hypothetical protein
MSVNVNTKHEGPTYTFDPLEDHTVTSMIDHIMIDESLANQVEKCIIVDNDYNPSDHLPVIAVLSFSSGTEINKEYHKDYIQWQKYSSEEIHLSYTVNLAHVLKKIKQPEVEECDLSMLESYYESIAKCMAICAKDQIGIKSKTVRTNRKSFWCIELQMLYKQMGARRKRWRINGKLRGNDSVTYVQYKEDKRRFRKEFRERQEAWEHDYFEKIEKAAEIDQSKFWQLIKKRNTNGPAKCYEIKFEDKSCTSTREIVEGWAGYFSKLYSPLHTDAFDENFKQTIRHELNAKLKNETGYCKTLDSGITVDEIQVAVKDLAMKKAGGFDGLTNEHIKYGGKELYAHLSLLYTLMLATGKVPYQMKKGLMITLLKPGKKIKSQPDNYRGITLLPVVYKLFEKVTLTRMVQYLKDENFEFPDPLQCAYQKLLSSLNATFSIQETIKYNQERGSKMFMCLMDNRKAFDIVWHDGLFVLLHRLGICNKLWRLIIDAYTGVQNTVLHNGVQSAPFDVLQSSRQGSLWRAFFYLVYINRIINVIHTLNCGAYVGNIFSGIHLQADDIALISTTRDGLQRMMNACYRYACQWRFLIHPDKTVIQVYGECNRQTSHCHRQRKWFVGPKEVYEVSSHKHCGILLVTSKSTVHRTKDACRKGRGIMASLYKQDKFGQGNLNPLTGLKLYKTIVMPSSLFGCELWTELSNTEILMLERMQRFCAKVIQKLGRQTRSNICCKMLALPSLKSYIDGAKLKFWHRISQLKSTAVSQRILLQRLFQAKLLPEITHGFAEEIIEICNSYKLEWFCENYINNGQMPDKIPFKNIVKISILEEENERYQRETENDEDFIRFHKVHPNIARPSPLWQISKAHPYMLDRCYNAARIIAYPNVSADPILCEFCGQFFKDSVMHYVVNCGHTYNEREQFWDIVLNELGVVPAANLNTLEDDELVTVILGGPSQFFSTVNLHMDFVKISINFLNKVMKKANLYVEK